MSADPSPSVFKESLPSSLDSYQEFVQSVLTELESLGWPTQPDLFAIHMALEESISNAIRHGNKQDDSKRVEVECRLSEDVFWAQVCDEGPGFCPKDVPDCRDNDRLEVPGGRGLALIKAYMTICEYNEHGNCLTIEKRRGDETTPGG
ncbi:anti-sigma F factor [Adhaeretor mobilis]|uniref:Anti-sigma F factor n=2 Tax=Adhaeretor mobilis TaxID=1930276 RepID=A0A517MT59_9BACT|nr:anti-sigma F factor [Adhaeretor mobilis]